MEDSDILDAPVMVEKTSGQITTKEPHLSNKNKRKLRQALSNQIQNEHTEQLNEDRAMHMPQTLILNKRPKISNSSTSLSMKKLLIFDLNHVLLDRTPLTSNFTLRPHVISFLQEMNQYFTLAVWSSMKKSKHSRQLIRLLFQSDDPNPHMKIPILFSWFQNQCHPIYHPNNSKPTFLKNLKQVWRQYPEYSAKNTVIVDDSIEKCVNNPTFSVLIPKPFHFHNVIQNTTNNDKNNINHGFQSGVLVAEEMLVMGVAFDPQTQTMRETCHTEIFYSSATAGDNSNGKNNTDNENNTYNNITMGDYNKNNDNETNNNKNETAEGVSLSLENEEEDTELKVDSRLRCYLRELGRFAGTVEEYVTTFGDYDHLKRQQIK